MKTFLKSVVLLAVLFAFAACSESDDAPVAPEQVSGEVYYALNSGDWKSNNSSLTMYDASTGAVAQGYFELVNGRKLGNTANDVIVYGSKMYIAVSGEGVIEVTDLNAKSLNQIECGAQPRYLTAHDGKVYATYYDGHVARIDTVTMQVDAKVEVGRNPEQLAVCAGKLFVANSGGMDYNTELGYDNTVSVVDLVAFEEIEKVEVACNPAVVVAAGDNLYVASYGNYYDVPSVLQQISADGVASVVEVCSNMTELCYSTGRLYGFFSSYDANWNATTTYLSYGVADKSVDSPWIKESFLPAPYKVCAVGKYVCVTSSDYINNGDVYFYDTDGMLAFKIAAGLNPVKVVSLK